MIGASKTQKRAIEIYSHAIAAQRIWLDRINGEKTDLKIWEVFETKIMLELLEINYVDIKKVIEKYELRLIIFQENEEVITQWIN
jgi:hypothetical protein